jgi:hypothetical protein
MRVYVSMYPYLYCIRQEHPHAGKIPGSRGEKV